MEELKNPIEPSTAQTLLQQKQSKALSRSRFSIEQLTRH